MNKFKINIKYINLIIFLFGNLIIFLLSGEDIFPQVLGSLPVNTPNYYKLHDSSEIFHKINQGKKFPGWRQFKRWDQFWDSRVDRNGNFPNGKKVFEEIQNYLKNKNISDKILSVNQWHELGPRTLYSNKDNPAFYGNGRINCVRVMPDSSNIIWAGSASGGLWKSTDGGKSWADIPFTQFLSIGISDIQISASNPSIIYAATGDANGWQTSRCMSAGIIKSTDRGYTWELTKSYGIDSLEITAKLAVHPLYSDVVLAAASSGIIKTIDGGKNWYSVYSDEFVRDISFVNDNPFILFAATHNFNGNSKILKSTDMGETWTENRIFDNANRIKLAISQLNGNKIYAICSDKSTGAFGGFFISNNGGVSWDSLDVTINPEPNITPDLVESQGFYNLSLEVTPVNDNTIFAGGVSCWKSTDGGYTWNSIQYGNSFGSALHFDIHDIYFNPSTLELFCANDGGLFKSNDFGEDWINLSSGLSITQFYKFGSSILNGEVMFGGSQDNGMYRYRHGYWDFISSGDMMETAVDYINPLNVYFIGPYGFLYRSLDGGETYKPSPIDGFSGAWVTPFLIDP
ncbi:MAG: hypothetical protein QG635_853, partial [Bacteroidota bacterium]|nr:hypothetical protein [Bacteroidota bacterium]